MYCIVFVSYHGPLPRCISPSPGLYTKSLIVLSLFGCVCMICQPIFGGVDKNPLTLAYSIYVAIWSITFLEAYKRRERELARRAAAKTQTQHRALFFLL